MRRAAICAAVLSIALASASPAPNAGAATNRRPANPYYLAVVGDTLFFIAWSDDGTKDQVLWKSDGTVRGTRVLEDVNGSGTGSCCSGLTSSGGYLFFEGYKTLFSNNEPWISDGTRSGTRMLKDVNPGKRGSDAGCCIDRGFLTIGEQTYFQAYDDERGLSLWKTDGTTEGTAIVRDFDYHPDSISDTEVSNFVNFSGTLYFSAPSEKNRSGAIWKSDGTSEGTVEVYAQDTRWDPQDLTVSGETLYFVGDTWDDPNPFEIWKTDGTTEGTIRIGDDRFGQKNRHDEAFEGEFYFSGERSRPFVPRLWKTTGDGTDIAPVTARRLAKRNFPGEMIKFKGDLYFVARDTDHNRELWRTDGTAEGTKRLKDITKGTGFEIRDLTKVGKRLFFFVGEKFGRAALWRTNGTAKGTKKIKAGKTWSEVCCDSVSMKGRLYFVAQRPGWNQSSLWVSNGTAKGTKPLRRTR